MSSVIAIIGAGLVGRAWALVFARAGHTVRIYDPAAGMAEDALAWIDVELPAQERIGLLRGRTPAAVRSNLSVAPTLATALDGAVHVQENVPETLEAKLAVFRELDAAAGPETVLASSTSGIVASSFSEELPGRARCLVGHPLNPPHLIPLVEIVPAPWTADDVVARARALYADSGQAPIVLKREVPGFVINRLQGAFLHEAVKLVEDGITDVEGVDAAVKDGLGLRWSFMGPFETIDLNAPDGIADYIERFGQLYLDLAADSGPARPWTADTAATLEAERRRILPANGLKSRAAWRNRRLTALMGHKTAMQENDA